MPEETFYSETIHPTVAQYIAEHGGKVQTERIPPTWVFHKVTCDITSRVPVGSGDRPIYRYTLVDGAVILVQFQPGKGAVPGHPNCSWAALYVYKNEAHA
jgi:hypothetical protein